MGHLYPENISKYLVHKLFTNWLNRKKLDSGCFVDEGILEKPKPLKVYDIINHFTKKISQMNQIISLLSSEKDIKLLTNLMKRNFGVNSAEGCYLDSEMIKMAIYECLGTWKNYGIVKEIDKEWFFIREIICGKTMFLDKSIKDEVIKLLEKKKVNDLIIKYTYKFLEKVGDLDSLVIHYIDM